MEKPAKDAVENASPKLGSVAETILEQYFTALGKAEGFDEIAVRLRTAVHEKGASNDAAIKSALFGEEAS